MFLLIIWYNDLCYFTREKVMERRSTYRKPNAFFYGLTKCITTAFVKIVFRRKYIRNELKGVKGPYVVICNHECALDGLYMFGVNKRRHTFVISQAILNSLPVYGIVKKLNMVEKQQFQTNVSDMRKIKDVVASGEPLVIYPAGLMTENGLSTPIPQATYKTLKWLGVDVYVARVTGSYFVMPKWSKGFRSGRTYLDIYKLFDKDELASISEEQMKDAVDDAILYDAYEEQEKLLIKYKHGNSVSGLENVVYACPHCKKEFTIKEKNGDTLYCTECGYEQTADEYGFLHAKEGYREIRHVSDWDLEIYDELYDKVAQDENYSLSTKTEIWRIDKKTHKYFKDGDGELTINRDEIRLVGNVHGEDIDKAMPTGVAYVLPNKPGKHVEMQIGNETYRCVLSDGKLVVKYLQLLKIFFKMKTGVDVKYRSRKEI